MYIFESITDNITQDKHNTYFTSLGPKYGANTNTHYCKINQHIHV
jgi:hypothetical protein